MLSCVDKHSTCTTSSTYESHYGTKEHDGNVVILFALTCLWSFQNGHDRRDPIDPASWLVERFLAVVLKVWVSSVVAANAVVPALQ